MQREPPPFIWAVPDEKNILNWNYIIRGPPDSPFAGGEYHGVLLFPPEYPFKPPGIKMFTPSGRFQPDRKICFSMSDFHPGTWNPAWSVATILTGLLSFMLSDEITTGAIKATDQQKRFYAAKSHSHNITQMRFKEAFPDFCNPLMKDLPNMGITPSSAATPTATTPSRNPGDLPENFLQTSPSQPLGSTHPDAVQIPISAGAIGPLNANDQDNWIDSLLRVLGEKWRWAAVIMLAVIVSRVSSK